MTNAESKFCVCGYHNSKFVCHLYLSAPPVFKDNGPTDYTVRINGKVKFRCSVRGVPRPLLLWYYNNTLIPSTHDRRRMSRFGIIISNVRKEDEGMYACHVSNKHGEKWKNFTLKVEGKHFISFCFPCYCSLDGTLDHRGAINQSAILLHKDSVQRLSCEVDSQLPNQSNRISPGPIFFGYTYCAL